MNGELVVRKVEGGKMMKQFIMLPWSARIYENDRSWVPPLIHDLKTLFSRRKSYFFEIGDAEFFLAYRDNIPVGRISAHVNHLYEEKYDRETGFFGFYESINDIEVAHALFEAAADWLRNKGKKVMNGPQSFSVYDSVGFVVEGYDVMPSVGLFNFAPYYQTLAESWGFQKCIDWFCFLVRKIDDYKPYLKDIRGQILETLDVEFKTLQRGELKKRARDIHMIFNAAWEGNWGHLPLTDRQFKMFFDELKLVYIPELAIFAEKDGRTIGFILSLPDINPALRLLDGHLYPWRVLRFFLNAKKTTRIRTIVMGVLPEFRGKKIDDIFYLRTIEDGIRLGFTESDCSLIVETNQKMIGALKPLKAERRKTYRIYEKRIDRSDAQL